MVVPINTIVRGIGVQLEPAQIADLLSRMQLQAKVEGTQAVQVLVPPTRSDVLHACDVMEVSKLEHNSYHKHSLLHACHVGDQSLSHASQSVA